MTKETTTMISSQDFLEHWQGHRKLTRKAIEVFPEKEFFTFSIGGMRPFYELVMEMINIAKAGVNGIVTNNWTSWKGYAPKVSDSPTKEEILKIWDEVTEEINEMWPKIPPSRFQEMLMTFGQYESPGYLAVLYWVDNEIHHRGQGYVYLRALGITPPFFWER